jgi:hypothetical protein
MNTLMRCTLVAVALSLGAAAPAFAQDARKGSMQAGTAARPANTDANKPSESGAQTSMPSGAATGAGQPQGGGQPASAESAGSAKTKAQSDTRSSSKTYKSRSKSRKHRNAKSTTSESAADSAQSAH